MAGTAYCDKCGLLALWNTETLQADEVDRQFRETGELAQGFSKHALVPICTQGRRDIPAMVREKQDTHGGRRGALLYVLREGHTCPDFMAHQLGSSPKEHREMMHTEFVRRREDERDARANERENKRDDAARRDRLIGRVLTLVTIGVLAWTAWVTANH